MDVCLCMFLMYIHERNGMDTSERSWLGGSLRMMGGEGYSVTRLGSEQSGSDEE